MNDENKMNKIYYIILKLKQRKINRGKGMNGKKSKQLKFKKKEEKSNEKPGEKERKKNKCK